MAAKKKAVKRREIRIMNPPFDVMIKIRTEAQKNFRTEAMQALYYIKKGIAAK